MKIAQRVIGFLAALVLALTTAALAQQPPAEPEKEKPGGPPVKEEVKPKESGPSADQPKQEAPKKEEVAPEKPPVAPSSAAEAEKPSPVQILVAQLKSGPGEKRLEALNSILAENLTDKALLEPLFEVFADMAEANRPARPAALQALAKMRDITLTPAEKQSLLDAFITGLKDSDVEVQRIAVSAIRPGDAAAEAPLLAIVAGKEESLKALALRRLALIWATQPLDPKKGIPPAPAPLLQALEDNDMAVRNAAAMGFWSGGFKDKSAIPALLKIFNEGSEANPEGRAHALHALVAMRSAALSQDEQKQILAALEEGLKDSVPGVRYYAVWGIQRDDKDLVSALEALVRDEDSKVRALAHEKLYQLRGLRMPPQSAQAAVPLELLNGLADKDTAVRDEAVRSFWLGGYKDPAAIPLLLAILEDKRDEARMARLDALRSLVNIRPAATTDEDKKAISEAILSSLKDSYFGVRYQAAKSITAADTEAIPILRELENDGSSLVQTAAKEALKRLGNP